MPIDKRARAEITLFNPYHDRLGRFAFKKGGLAIQGNMSFDEKSGLSKKEQAEFSRAASDTRKSVKKYISGIPDSDTFVSSKVKKMGADGWFDVKNKSMYISPEMAKSLANGEPAGRVAFMHETIHSRDGDRVSRRGMTIKNVMREEGLTSLLTDYTYVKSYGRTWVDDARVRQSAYLDYQATVASYYMSKSGGDSSKAWKAISGAHAKGYDYEVGYDQMSREVRGRSIYQDYESLLRGIEDASI